LAFFGLVCSFGHEYLLSDFKFSLHEQHALALI
jgi:hypothetical protein